MIDIPVQVFYRVDEAVQVGVLEGRYAQFENNAFVGYISAEEALAKYTDAGIRVPDEFGGLRAIIDQRIAKLQALL